MIYNYVQAEYSSSYVAHYDYFRHGGSQMRLVISFIRDTRPVALGT